MSTLINDIKYGFRMLIKSPGFTAVVVLMLALGIGANGGVFTVFEQVLMRSLPVKDPDSLVVVVTKGKMIGSSWGAHMLSYPMFKDLREKKTLFQGVLCRCIEKVAVNDGSGAEQAEIELVSGYYFDVLGVPPALGRVFVAEDETAPGANPVIVLSHDFWKTRFGGDPDVIGRTLFINDSPMEVVGVAASGFRGVSLDSRPKLFVPITMKKQITPWWQAMDDRRTQWVRVFARLKSGISRRQAEVAVQTPYRQILEQEVQEAGFAGVSASDREQFLQSRLTLLPGRKGHSFLSAEFGGRLFLLMGLAGLVLLVTCANISNLLIARAAQRQKDITMRLAIGASRLRILRQMLVESLLLAFAGGLAALLVTAMTTRAVLLFAPGQLRPSINPEMNGKMLAFNFIVSSATALLFGLLPAWRATQVDLVSTLKEQAASVVGGPKARLRQTMVVTQICLSLILLIGSGLFIRSLIALYRIDPGFRTTNLVRFKLDPTQGGYGWQRRLNFCRQLQTQLSSVPGVISAAFARMPLLEGNIWTNGIVVEGYQAKPGENVVAQCNSISRNYCKTLNMPMRLGREFNELDEAPGANKVIIINEAFVRSFLPDRNPIGCLVGFRWSSDAQPDREIVGVVQDSRNAELRRAAFPQVLAPYSQIGITDITVYVRTSLSSQNMFQTIRKQVRNLDPGIPVYDMKTMEDQLDSSLANERLVGFLSSVFGVLATLLAMIGLYGVMCYSVSHRIQEIGVRIALGAQRSSVVSMVLREGMTLAALGVTIGLAGAFALTRILRRLLFGINPTDPMTFISTALVLVFAALVACYLPARRAANIEPMEALRYE